MAFDTPRRIQVKYDEAAVKNMISLLQAAPFPDRAPIDASTPWEFGIEFDYLKKLKHMFEAEWSWKAFEEKIAKFDHYLVHFENDGDVLDLHYVHVKSPRSDAIPLILLHGWPGTFFDFHKVIEPLTNPPSSDLQAFHVVVPSIPGYFLSTLPRRDGWSATDTARIYNGLMTSVLGYSKYVAQGGDWGSLILLNLEGLFPDSVVLAHFNFLFLSASPDTDQSKYTDLEKRLLKRRSEFLTSGSGYFQIQSTKPFTIGISIASSPLAVLAYIGEKIYSWSDPKLVDPYDILNTVALYYLSGSFATSVVIYNQARKGTPGWRSQGSGGKVLLKNKFGYSVFPYELVVVPKPELEQFGPLVFHREHSNGGHFPALDIPNEYVGDLREFFGKYWGTP
ncbi:alpha/beta-hydrolase [Fomitiporia mediterranea MF3/22]|uniref:alpha/beta-hydrolase n=1 Tax=Fomitiporia mediterranea (strain MF3/22) TaxID=694068 RepID=UPI00044085D4|nr:alpha/beta-hydrolase [Fomitiporia mediterranea MF3/22]EJD04934.1 alpha/beta-hydrolase [Fomitiporia mediterranea MF3/22]